MTRGPWPNWLCRVWWEPHCVHRGIWKGTLTWVPTCIWKRSPPPPAHRLPMEKARWKYPRGLLVPCKAPAKRLAGSRSRDRPLLEVLESPCPSEQPGLQRKDHWSNVHGADSLPTAGRVRALLVVHIGCLLVGLFPGRHTRDAAVESLPAGVDVTLKQPIQGDILAAHLDNFVAHLRRSRGRSPQQDLILQAVQAQLSAGGTRCP